MLRVSIVSEFEYNIEATMSKAILITKTLGHASILGVRNLTAEAVDARLWHSTSAGVHEGCKVRSIDEILTADSHWKQIARRSTLQPPGC